MSHCTLFPITWAFPALNMQLPKGTLATFSKLPISGWGEPPAGDTSFSWGTPKGAEDNWIRPRSLGCNCLGYSGGALVDKGWSRGTWHGKAVTAGPDAASLCSSGRQ